MAPSRWNPFTKPVEPPPSPEVSAALADLERLVAERPELAPAARSLSNVIRAAFFDPVPDGSTHADPELLHAAWRSGVPAFRAGESPPALDAGDLRSRVVAVLDVLRAGNPLAGPFLDALKAGRADPHAWAVAWLSDLAIDVPPDIDEALARSVLRLSMLPVLSRVSGRLAPHRPDGLWSRGDCPNCGEPPSLAESRGLEQRRYWRCGLCAADWEGGRFRCPFCGEDDHRRLSYLFAEGEQDRYRLSVCASCGGRLKVVSTLAPLSAPALLVAELATVHLDLAEG